MKIIIYLYNCIFDFVRGLKHNYNSPFETQAKRLFYRIIITSHTVEKGLSLASPRPKFGRSKIAQLMVMLHRYDGDCGSFPVAMARGALQHYLDHHKSIGVSDPFFHEVEIFLTHSREKLVCDETGGLKIIDYSTTSGMSAMDRRFSCRTYSRRKIAAEQIAAIVAAAQRAPSQCNRQSTRVHCYQQDRQIQELLTLQGGGTGFAEDVSNLFVVSSELSAWGGPGQRNQAYVDGSLFSMCLMLSIVDQGLQCCPLNLAVTNRRELHIARIGQIPVDQRLIMMIAFGESSIRPSRAAASPRLSTDQVLTMHGKSTAANERGQ